MLDYLLLVGRVVHSLATEGHVAELRDSKLGVLLTVLSFLNFEKGCAEVSVRAIAERAAVPEPTVYRALQELEIGGFIARENRQIRLGHKLEDALQAHEARATKQQSVFEPKAPKQDTVELTEQQANAAVRKNTRTSDIRQLVLRYGSDHVDAAIREMEAQYPSDELIRASFGALVRRACENSWVSEKRDRVEARERVAAQAETTAPAPEATVAVDPDGVRLPIIERRSDVVVVQVGVDGAGQPKLAFLRPMDWPLFRWEAG